MSEVIRDEIANGIGVTYRDLDTGEMSIGYFPVSEEDGLRTGQISVLRDKLNKFPGFPELGVVFEELNHAVDMLNIYLSAPRKGEKEEITLRNLVSKGYREDAVKWILYKPCQAESIE